MKEQTTNLLDEECAIKLRAMETKYDMTLCLVKEVLFKRRRLIWLSCEYYYYRLLSGAEYPAHNSIGYIEWKISLWILFSNDSLTDRKTKRQNIFISYNI